MRLKPASVVLLAGACALLSACSSGHGDLHHWMSHTRASMHPFVKPLPKIATFKPFTYTATTQADPFSFDKTHVSVQAQVQALPPGYAHWINHVPGPLEQFDLSQIVFKGTMDDKSHGRVALVQVDKTIYMAHAGEYIGRNHGRIESIDESHMKIEELTQDSTGVWTPRSVEIDLHTAASSASKP